MMCKGPTVASEKLIEGWSRGRRDDAGRVERSWNILPPSFSPLSHLSCSFHLQPHRKNDRPHEPLGE